jgi:hypothetical protein
MKKIKINKQKIKCGECSHIMAYHNSSGKCSKSIKVKGIRYVCDCKINLDKGESIFRN